MPVPGGLLHCACMSGYLDSSNALAATGSASAAASVIAPIALRIGMILLPSKSSACGLSRPAISAARRSVVIAERVVNVAQEAGPGGDALWGGPFPIEIGERIGCEDFLLGLSLVEQLFDPVARHDHHVVEFLKV